MTKICNDKTGSDKKLHVFCEFVIAAIIGSLVSFIHFPSAWIAAAIAFIVQPLLRLGSRLGFGRLPRRCSSSVPRQLLHMARYRR